MGSSLRELPLSDTNNKTIKEETKDGRRVILEVFNQGFLDTNYCTISSTTYCVFPKNSASFLQYHHVVKYLFN
jgi:hypothetical protein